MSAQTPFSPMGSPAKVVSQEKLQEILKRRGGKVSVDGSSGVATTTYPEVEVELSGPDTPGTPLRDPPKQRARGPEQRPDEAVQSGPAALEWSKPVNHGGGSAMVHDVSRRYRIDILSKRGGDASYTCWAVAQAPGQLNERLGMVDSPIVARRLCDDHNARQV